MTTKSPIFRYDFTLAKDYIKSEKEIIDVLDIYCKKYTFQLEKGKSTDYIHYQGRISLKTKRRKQELIGLLILPKQTTWSPTQTKTKGFDYCMKEDTRVLGPWKDTDKPAYVPRQYRGKMKTLRPFQKYILDNAYNFEDRCINLIVCKKGNIGKSMVASLSELYGNGIDLPVVNDAEKLMQSCCNICMAKQVRNPSPIFVDLPRAFNQEKMNGIFTAIEQIKKGKLYDMRHHHKEWWIDSPQIWVFTNTEQNLNYLSKDRWKIWTVDKKLRLKKLSYSNKIKKKQMTAYDLDFMY